HTPFIRIDWGGPPLLATLRLACFDVGSTPEIHLVVSAIVNAPYVNSRTRPETGHSVAWCYRVPAHRIRGSRKTASACDKPELLTQYCTCGTYAAVPDWNQNWNRRRGKQNGQGDKENEHPDHDVLQAKSFSASCENPVILTPLNAIPPEYPGYDRRNYSRIV